MKTATLFISLLLLIDINAQKAVVGTPYTTVVYTGLQNPIDIFFQGVSTKDLVIKEYQGCEIIRSNHQYFIKPKPNINYCSFIVGIKSGQTVKWFDTAVLPVRNLPKGEARFGELNSGNYTLSEILIQNKLTYHTDAYFKDFEKNVTIIQFRIILMPKIGYMELFSFNHASVAGEIKTHIGKLKSGDLFVIDDIKVSIFDKELQLLPITITIQEEIYTDPVSVGSYPEQTYKLDSINDSTYHYESYFPDGKIYQQGNVLTDTKYRKYNYLKLKDQDQIYSEPYEKHLMNIHKGYYPVSEWNVFDSAGHHKMTINYMVIRDSIFTTGLKEIAKGNIKNYAIVADGGCVFYKSDGVIEKIIYYNKGIKR